MSHTKGPWLIDGNGLDRSWNISGNESICDVRTSREDALLMSKAPELLESLKALIKAAYAYSGGDIGLTGLELAIEECESVITDAEGSES